MKKLSLFIGLFLIFISVVTASENNEINFNSKSNIPKINIIKEKEIIYLDKSELFNPIKATSSKYKVHFKTALSLKDFYRYVYEENKGKVVGPEVSLGVINEIKFDLTERDLLKIETYHEHALYNIARKRAVKVNVDYNHNFDKIFGKLELSSSLGYEHNDKENNVYIAGELDFSNYLLENTVEEFVLVPKYEYIFNPDDSTKKNHKLGLSMDIGFNLPYEFKLNIGSDDLIAYNTKGNIITGKPYIKVEKDYNLFEWEAHSAHINIPLKGEIDWKFNLKGKKEFKVLDIKADASPKFKYTYKASERISLFASTGSKITLNYNTGNNKFNMGVGPIIEAGFKLSL